MLAFTRRLNVFSDSDLAVSGGSRCRLLKSKKTVSKTQEECVQTTNRNIDTASVQAMTGHVCFHAGVTRAKEAMPHVQTKTKFTSHPPRAKQTREELDVKTKMRKAVNVE